MIVVAAGANLKMGSPDAYTGKTRYKGLAKNEAQLFSLFGLNNVVLVKRRLLDFEARGVCLERGKRPRKRLKPALAGVLRPSIASLSVPIESPTTRLSETGH
ncbi:hypothetical protein [Rhizobacter sp. P5_C2]